MALPITRRKFVSSFIRIIAFVPLAAVMPKSLLAADDPSTYPEADSNQMPAKGLQYSVDAKQAKARTAAKKDQYCDNCKLYKKVKVDKLAGELGTCTVIPKKLVRAKGWCMVWIKL